MLEIANKTIEKMKNAVFLVVEDSPQRTAETGNQQNALSKNILFTGFQQI